MSKATSRHGQGHSGGVSLVLVVLNLVTYVLANSKCATLYSANSYHGSPFSLADGSKNAYLRQMNYVPQSVRVTPGCFLTMFDTYGGKQTLDRDYENIGWFPYRILDATCCECGGCMGAASKLDNVCSRLFENPRCDSCSGYRLDLQVGDKAKYFGPLDKKMTSVALRPGCTLTVFSEPNFTGWRFNFTNSNNMMGSNWHKQISSAQCGCDPVDYNGQYPIVDPVPTNSPYPGYITLPTKAPPMTLPTVPTTRPPITLPTVPTTTRAPITLPTVPTTKVPITLPTVPTTKVPITLPTVPTTKVTITLPTVPTTKIPITLPTVPTTRVPITLPTVPTTRKPVTLPTEASPEDDSSGFDNWYGADNSPEILEETSTVKTTTSTPPPTTTTTTTENYSAGVFEFPESDEYKDESEEDEEDWGWPNSDEE